MIGFCIDIAIFILAMCVGVWTLKLGLAVIAAIGTFILGKLTFGKEDKKP